MSFARQLGPEPQGSTAGWAVGGFFVPFADLVVPVQAALAAWRATFAAERDAWGQPVEGRGTSLATAWWAAWILANIVCNVAFRMWLRPRMDSGPPSPAELQAATWIDTGGDALSLGGAGAPHSSVPRRMTAATVK